MSYRALCVWFAVLFACGPTHEQHGPRDAGTADGGPADATSAPHTLQALVVTPTNPIVQLDLGAPGAQGFTVTGTYADGTTEDVTAQATWSVTNSAVGTMSGATLDIPAFPAVTAEVSKISANVGAFTGDAQITVVAYRQTGAQQDFFFILPYQDPNGPQSRGLDFATAIPALDVFFLMDTTGSMEGEIGNLQSALTGTVIPDIQAAIPDTQFGVGALEDFPVYPYGDTEGADCGGLDTSPDQPFKLRQAITSNATAVQTAVDGLVSSNGYTIGCGGDTPEGGIESVYQAATGDGLSGPDLTSVAANHTGIGGVGFRQGTMPVIVDISDAVSHGTDETATCNSLSVDYSGSVLAVAHSREQTAAALGTICARVVGISALPNSGVNSCTAQEYMTYLATQTGARVPPAAWDVGTRPAGCGTTQCCTGPTGVGLPTDADGLCPVVFEVSTNGTGVSDSVVTGIEMLTRFATFDVPTEEDGVTTDIDGNALPAPHTTADFLEMVTPSSYVLPPPPPVIPAPTIDANGLQFDGVTPGTQVTFAVTAFNDFVPPTADAQFFKATIKVLAGGCNVLDQRDVLVLVPPMPVVIQ